MGSSCWQTSINCQESNHHGEAHACGSFPSPMAGSAGCLCEAPERPSRAWGATRSRWLLAGHGPWAPGRGPFICNTSLDPSQGFQLFSGKRPPCPVRAHLPGGPPGSLTFKDLRWFSVCSAPSLSGCRPEEVPSP